MKKSLVILLLLALPVLCFGAVIKNPSVTFKCQLLSVLNYVLALVSLISIKFFFWPGENNRMIFQLFNMAFTIVFYWAGLTFIINHTYDFEGFEGLAPAAVIKRFFLNYDFSMVLQGVIVFSLLINILYVFRFGRKYYMDLT